VRAALPPVHPRHTARPRLGDDIRDVMFFEADMLRGVSLQLPRKQTAYVDNIVHSSLPSYDSTVQTVTRAI